MALRKLLKIALFFDRQTWVKFNFMISVDEIYDVKY